MSTRSASLPPGSRARRAVSPPVSCSISPAAAPPTRKERMSFEKPRIVVVGAGAMGGLFGGLLAEGGLDVTLVDAWREHIATIQSDGLRIVGVGGDRAIKVTATTDAGEVKSADVVLFQCKAFANEAAARSV